MYQRNCESDWNVTSGYRDSLLRFYKNDSLFSNIVAISNKPYSFEIETYYLNDTLADNESQYENGVSPIATYPIVIDQKLIFKNDGVIKKEFYVPIKKGYRYNYKGKKVKCLQQSIWYIFSLKGESDIFFGVLGSGFNQFDDNDEFNGLYFSDGNIIFQGSSVNLVQKRKIDELLNRNNISDSLYRFELNEGGKRVDVFRNY